MTIASRTARLLAAGGGLALVLGLAAPASAESVTYRDGRDAGASLNDMLRVKLNHGADQVVVKVKFADLRKHSDGGPASIGIFIDTKPNRKGPEFRLGSGLHEGTDFQLIRMKNWKPVGEPKTCEHSLDLRFRKDQLVFRTARTCIGTPRTVRVGAKVTDLFDGSHPIHDWLKGPRRWIGPVTSG